MTQWKGPLASILFLGVLSACNGQGALDFRKMGKGKVPLETEPTQPALVAQPGHMNAEAAQVYQNLLSLNKDGKTILGQQRSSIVGIGRDGQQAFGDASYSFRSDLKDISGQHAGMLGLDVWDFAMKNPSWNQPAYAQAIRDFYAQGEGGLITLDWHMRGCDTASVRDAWGNEGVPGIGFNLTGNADPQLSCTCRIVNEEPWRDGKSWLDWLYEQKLDRFAEKLKVEKLTDVPLLFRPFHEQTGSWFWWGAASWDCKNILKNPNAKDGPEVFKALFRKTVEYLRDKKGLKNLIYVFAADKLHYAPWIGSYGSTQTDAMTVDQLKQSFYHAYPGNDVVDVVGLDLYYPATAGAAAASHAGINELFRKNLRALTLVAKETGKVSALTETGNWNLHNERSQADSQFFSKYLSELLLNDSQIKLAYLLFWENRKQALGEYYTPFEGHAQLPDFKRFLDDSRVLQYGDIAHIYKASLAAPPVTGSCPAPAGSDPGKCPVVSDQTGIPSCKSAGSDPDGDGWGWEDSRSCKVVKLEDLPNCVQSGSDPDGDGWGWEQNRSCKVVRVEAPPTCTQMGSDPDGDGWGWEQNRSCKVAMLDGHPVCVDRGSDPDGDGWGWEQNRSCRMAKL